jgi:Arc/MetJ-type ribon-helix-helix transcriptional regulator
VSTSLLWIGIVMGVASNSDAVREGVGDMCASPADRTEKLRLLPGLQWLAWCELSQAESTSEFLAFPIMSEEVAAR